MLTLVLGGKVNLLTLGGCNLLVDPLSFLEGDAGIQTDDLLPEATDRIQPSRAGLLQAA